VDNKLGGNHLRLDNYHGGRQSDSYRWHILSYEHIGQHGGADYQGVIDRTVPATEAEYSGLKRELEGTGYNLEAYKRQTAKMREKCQRRDAA
jgi:hypothetical protein